MFVDRLPRFVEQLVAESHGLRWLLEGFQLGRIPVDCTDEHDARIAGILAKRGCDIAEIASAIYHRHRGSGTARDSRERAFDIARCAMGES